MFLFNTVGFSTKSCKKLESMVSTVLRSVVIAAAVLWLFYTLSRYRGIPTVFIIGRNGEVVERVTDMSQLEAKVAQHMKSVSHKKTHPHAQREGRLPESRLPPLAA